MLPASGNDDTGAAISHSDESLPSSGWPPTPERIDAEELFPWTFQQATAGKIVAISVDEFPPEAARDQETSHRFGIKSSLTFPLRTWNDKLIGAVSFSTVSETRSWPEDLIKRLQLVAQIFANALVRKLADIALSESEERLCLASASANVGLWALDLETHQFWTTDKGLELFGIPPGQTLSFDDFIKLVHHEDRDKVCRVVDHAPGSDDDEVVEYRIVKADGSIRWMASRGRRQINSKSSFGDALQSSFGDALHIFKFSGSSCPVGGHGNLCPLS
jgi:PAS domain-containing protein